MERLLARRVRGKQRKRREKLLEKTSASKNMYAARRKTLEAHKRQPGCEYGRGNAAKEPRQSAHRAYLHIKTFKCRALVGAAERVRKNVGCQKQTCRERRKMGTKLEMKKK